MTRMKNAINSLKVAAYGAAGMALAAPFAMMTKAASDPGGWQVSSYSVFGLPGGTVTDIVDNLLMWLLWIFGTIGIIGFVISGIMYLTAGGDAEQEKKAKKAMLMSIIGVVVGLAGWVILQAATEFLKGEGNL